MKKAVLLLFPLFNILTLKPSSNGLVRSSHEFLENALMLRIEKFLQLNPSDSSIKSMLQKNTCSFQEYSNLYNELITDIKGNTFILDPKKEEFLSHINEKVTIKLENFPLCIIMRTIIEQQQNKPKSAISASLNKQSFHRQQPINQKKSAPDYYLYEVKLISIGILTGILIHKILK